LITRKGDPGKIRDFSKKAWLLRRANGGTLCVGLQMATSSRLWVNNELYPQETSVATLYRVLPRQRLDLFTIISSPRKFVECLYYDVSPPPILPVLSRFIEFACHMQLYCRTVIYSLYNHTNHIHSYNYKFIHDRISHPEPCSAVSLQINLYLSLCQATSSNKRITCNHHFHQKCRPQCAWSRDVANQSFWVASLNNQTTCILPFIFNHMPSGKSEQPDSWHRPLIFYHMPSGKPEQPDSLRLPFYFYRMSIGKFRPTNSLHLPFFYLMSSGRFSIWTTCKCFQFSQKSVIPNVSGQEMSPVSFKLPVLNNGPLEFTFLSCFKPPVLNNGPLEFTFLSCFKRPFINNGPLEFTFLILFQAASPKQRTAWVYLFNLVSSRQS